MNQLDKIAIIESSMKMLYREISRDWDTLNNYRNCNKNGTVWFHSAVMHPKDADGIASKNADGIANDADPDQTAPQEQSDLGLHCLLSPICPNT